MTSSSSSDRSGGGGGGGGGNSCDVHEKSINLRNPFKVIPSGSAGQRTEQHAITGVGRVNFKISVRRTDIRAINVKRILESDQNMTTESK
ncbi:hypothetical protein T12_5303 [Trichinella patagoniensis]|uniref:Uncharacterized protein n=1 Tax=Trichinella patagoniensis TaxID=990121 RepID=A0A0V0ZN85_9BILA|nr:hypothetical protein T12_5303 [Trichinella patagoniensis]